MRRRDLIKVIGGAVILWPRSVHAQQADRVRRIGVIMNVAENDPLGQTRLAAFLQALEKLGWSVGRNVRIDARWGAGEVSLYRKYATELVALAPDVLFAPNTSVTRALLEVSRTVPIVFSGATDPVAGGLVESLARPGGNVTGFSQREFALSTKSLELIKELVPNLMRVAVLRDSTTTGGVAQISAIQTAAPSFQVDVIPIDLRDDDEIERAIVAFAQQPNGGLIVTTSARATVHREVIITLAARHRLPAIYPFRFYVTGGGLISIGPDEIEGYRLAAGYVDRILKGAKPADLPVQQPTKFELVINLKTAKTMGLTVPPTLLARATEVIE